MGEKKKVKEKYKYYLIERVKAITY